MALRSGCTRSQVGAVIVNEKNRIIATGYNGPPANSEITCASGCPRAKDHGDGRTTAGYGFDCVSIHAEANALLFCDRSTIEGGSLYVNAVPCPDCAKLIANSGLKHVYFIDDLKANRPSHLIVDYLLWHKISMLEVTQ
jgi:dCMP deaminase